MLALISLLCIGAVKDVVAPVSETAADVANDAQSSVQKQKPVGYIGSTIGGVRNLAGSVIGTAQQYALFMIYFIQ